MLASPTKITFKNTTKMSLNARFTTIMKSRPVTTPQTVKMQASTARLASEKNRRLAQQMERRPAVEEALGGGKKAKQPVAPVQARIAPAKVSVLDRLGNRGSARGRGTSVNAQSTRGSIGIASRIGGVRRGQAAFNGSRRGATGRGRGAFNKARVGNNTRGRPINRGKRGGGNFRGKGKTQPANKGDLDNDLDSYMSKTKGSMDAELDAYRANAK